jgi:hypothetical protein
MARLGKWGWPPKPACVRVTARYAGKNGRASSLINRGPEPCNFHSIMRFLKALAEALFDDFEELAIPVDQVIENVQQFFALVGGTKASEISWSLRIAELAMGPLFNALSVEHRKDRIKSRMQNSQFDAFQDMAKLRSIIYFG